MSVDLGAAIYIALKPILKIYAIIFVGYLLARYNIVSMETARGISNMVVNAILPCLTFNKIVTGISDQDIKEVGVIVLSAMLLFAVGTVCALIAKLLTPVPKKWFWGLMFAGIFPNISDLPIAYVQSMGNGAVFSAESADKGVAYCCIFLTSQSFMMMNFGMWRLVGFDFKEKVDDENRKSDIEERPGLEKHIPEADFNECSRHDTGSLQHLESMGKISRSSIGERDESCVYSNSNVMDDSQSDDSSGGTQSQAESLKSLGIMPIEYAHTKNLDDASSLRAYRTQSVVSSPSALEASRIKLNYVRGANMPGMPQVMKGGKSSMRRRRPSMHDVIEEYSAADLIKDGELDLSRPLTLTEDLGNRNAGIGSFHENDSISDREDDGGFSLSRTTTVASVNAKGKFAKFVAKYKLGWLVYGLINFIRPASLGALLGIIVAMIPWAKACFVITYVHVHNAPDGLPVLNFLMDFTSYIGDACVPLGLLMLGGTLARLEVKTLPKGFIRVGILMTFFRLMVIPVIGVAWANKLYELNWLDTVIGKFVMILTWSMPSATAQVYFTAFYTPVNGSHIQLDCLSLFFLMQYGILFITVPFVITYTLKVDLQL